MEAGKGRGGVRSTRFVVLCSWLLCLRGVGRFVLNVMGGVLHRDRLGMHAAQ